MHGLPLSAAPPGATSVQRRNFLNVQIDGIGVAIATSGAPFLPVFLARLGASNAQVGLLTAMPGITGLIIAFMIGRILQRQRQIVPWFSTGRFLVISGYALTGLVTFFFTDQAAVVAVLAIWALATVPQVIVNITWSLVMNGVAGPQHRYDLMTRRWTLLGLTSAVAVALVGQILNTFPFPVNYQIVYIVVPIGGLVSFYFSSHIVLPDNQPRPPEPGLGLRERLAEHFRPIIRERPFVSFMSKRFVFMFGSTLGVPLFPLYYVRVLNASDAWIGVINTAQLAVTLLGYTLWTRQSKSRGSRFVLLSTVLGMALYPALTALTPRIEMVAIYAGLSGLFMAGLELVFFDELMKTVPAENSAIFVAFAQSLQYMAAVASPLIGTWLADAIGLSGALLVCAGLRFIAFLLFARSR